MSTTQINYLPITIKIIIICMQWRMSLYPCSIKRFEIVFVRNFRLQTEKSRQFYKNLLVAIGSDKVTCLLTVHTVIVHIFSQYVWIWLNVFHLSFHLVITKNEKNMEITSWIQVMSPLIEIQLHLSLDYT